MISPKWKMKKGTRKGNEKKNEKNVNVYVIYISIIYETSEYIVRCYSFWFFELGIRCLIFYHHHLDG